MLQSKGICILIYCVFCITAKAQIPLDSISYAYFEQDKINQIKILSQKVKKDNKAWDFFRLARLYEAVNLEDSAALYYHKALLRFKQKNNQKGLIYALPFFVTILDAQNQYNFNLEDQKKWLEQLVVNQPKYSPSKVFLEKIKAHGELEKNNKTKAIAIYKDLKNNFKKEDSLAMYINLRNNLGVLLTNNQEVDSAKFYLSHALSLNQQYNQNLFKSYYNLGWYYYKQNNAKLALAFFDSAEVHLPNKHKIKSLSLLNQYKAKALELAGKYNQSLQYLKAHDALDSLVNEKQQNIAIYQIQSKYKNQELSKQLSIAQRLAKSYNRYKIYYLVGLIVTFLLSLYSFIRWKKVDYKKRKLQQERKKILLEKTELEEKHERIKKLVSKEHITLKNKAKVYLSDLMYLKSDGHYVLLFTKNNKEFVRAKLSNIEQELPPNFKRCHRSYIVNINYIAQTAGNHLELNNAERTQIPISRKYKTHFL